jgi:hypothetical protein
MAVVRTYECGECGSRFDKLHFDRADPAPPCPGCAALSAKQTQVPGGFAIKSDKSRAVDITQKICEEDYGMSDMNDRQREGDLAFKTPSHLTKHVDGFFNQGGPLLAQAKAGAAAAKAEGSNPFSLVQKVAKERGTAAPICNVVARA